MFLITIEISDSLGRLRTLGTVEAVRQPEDGSGLRDYSVAVRRGDLPVIKGARNPKKTTHIMGHSPAEGAWQLALEILNDIMDDGPNE